MKIEFDDEVQSFTTCLVKLVKAMDTHPVGALFLLLILILMSGVGLFVYRL